MESYRVAYPLPPEPSPSAVCIYVSTAAPTLTLADIDSLLVQSRARNERDGLTGVLLFGGGNFMQYVEGPGAAVDALRSRIATDRRHYDVHYILHSPLDRRRFTAWTMGFLSAEPRKLRAQYESLGDDEDLKAHILGAGSALEKVILKFYEAMR